MPPTPPPPLHPPLPPDKKPISPPLESLPHHQPAKEKKGKALIIGVALGTILTAVIGIILWYFNISINIILSALAPIWVGSITLIYSVTARH